MSSHDWFKLLIALASIGAVLAAGMTVYLVVLKFLNKRDHSK